MSSREKGFSVVEVVMAIVIIFLVGVVIYLFTQANQKKDTPSTAAQSATSASPTPSPTTSVADEQSAASSQVKAFYKKWVAQDVVYDPSKYPPSQWLKDGYVTQAAVDQENKYPQFDAATCSQNPLTFNEYTFDTPSITGTKGTMGISGVYSGMKGDTPKTLRFDLGLVKDGATWKIDAFNCPPAS